MDITISLNEVEFSAADQDLIKDCLNINANQLPDAFAKLCKTAFLEYVKMFKEKGLPTRADEVQQERLFFMLKHYYETTIPTENEISSIFQLTESQSRTLLRNTKSKYRTKLNENLKRTLRGFLASARQIDNQDYEFVCTSTTIIEDMNKIVTQRGAGLKPIEKQRNVASTYTCALDTYLLLQRELT